MPPPSVPAPGVINALKDAAPRRSISLNLRREGRPSLSVVPPSSASAGPSVSPSPVVPWSESGAQPATPSTAVVRSGRLSLRVRTPSATGGGADSPASRVTLHTGIKADDGNFATPRTPLSALYSPGAAKLGLGLGLPTAINTGTDAGASGSGDRYFSRIHSSLHTGRRSTFAAALDSTSNLTGSERLPYLRGGMAAPISAPCSAGGSRLTSETAATPMTPMVPFSYPATPIEAHDPMGGAAWRAELFSNDSNDLTNRPFALPPPSPLPTNVVQQLQSRSRATSLSGPAKGSILVADQQQQLNSGRTMTESIVDGLASLPGVVNFKNSWYASKRTKRWSPTHSKVGASSGATTKNSTV